MSIWPVEGGGASQLSWHKAKLAMALHGKSRHYHFKEIQRRHFNATAAKFFQRKSADDVIEEVLADLERAIAAVAARLACRLPGESGDLRFRMPAAHGETSGALGALSRLGYGVEMSTSGLILQAQSREEICADKLVAFALRPNHIVKDTVLSDSFWKYLSNLLDDYRQQLQQALISATPAAQFSM